MDNLKKIHRDTHQIDFKEIWSKGTFIFDSNVLLDLYRLPKSAREDLIKIFKNSTLKNRIWIGFQVILEFTFNRFEAISDQKNKFNSVRSLVKETLANYDQTFDTLTNELGKLKLKQRHSLIDPDQYVNLENIRNGSKFLYEFIQNLDELEKEQADVHDADKLKDLVLELFEGKIGAGFDKPQLKKLYDEGEKRYAAKTPPGYMDVKKLGSHLYEDKEYIRKYGDFILWKEIIEKAKSENLKYIVLVTGDVKEDWWHEKRGKKLGPRIELLNEIYYEAPSLDTFYIYDTSSFLQHAQKELNLDVKQSSIIETQNLIELSRTGRSELNNDGVYLEKLINYVAQNFQIKVDIERSVKYLPMFFTQSLSLEFALNEILDNVAMHSKDSYVRVNARIIGTTLQVIFTNLKKSSEAKLQEAYIGTRKGLEYSKEILSKDNIDLRVSETDSKFRVELFIPHNISFKKPTLFSEFEDEDYRVGE